MLCPRCKSPTKVIDTARMEDMTIRTRRCSNRRCTYQFGTEESRQPLLSRRARAYRRIMSPQPIVYNF